MRKHEIIEAVNKTKKGAFTRIVYATEPTLSSAGKKSGAVIVKHTEKTVRIGVKYHNMEAVKAAEAARVEPKREVTPWCHWEIEDVLAKHNTKDAYYLAVSYVNGGHHTKSEFYLNGEPITEEQLKETGYVVPSYFKNKEEVPVTQKINIDNIITIGGN